MRPFRKALWGLRMGGGYPARRQNFDMHANGELAVPSKGNLLKHTFVFMRVVRVSATTSD